MDVGSANPNFDPALARNLIGKLVLVGITHQTKAGEVLRQEQVFGTVVEADPQRGIAVLLQGNRAGETKSFPPCTTVFHLAAPGEYRLRTTGEVVVNPDFCAEWTATVASVH